MVVTYYYTSQPLAGHFNNELTINYKNTEIIVLQSAKTMAAYRSGIESFSTASTTDITQNQNIKNNKSTMKKKPRRNKQILKKCWSQITISEPCYSIRYQNRLTPEKLGNLPFDKWPGHFMGEMVPPPAASEKCLAFARKPKQRTNTTLFIVRKIIFACRRTASSHRSKW